MAQPTGFMVFKNGRQKIILDNFIASSKITLFYKNTMLKWIRRSREPAKLESKYILNVFLNIVCHKWGICERALIFISPPMQFAEVRYTSVETNFCIMK